jgi:hypothetical protein
MIFRSPFPDVEIPEVPLTEFVLSDAAGHAERPALIDGVSGHVTTYAQLACSGGRARAARVREGRCAGALKS